MTARAAWLRRARAEDGLLGGLDALAFGALVFVTTTLLIVNVWSVVDTRLAATAAAREAVRDLVESPDWDAVTAHERALARARETLRQHGRSDASLDATVVTVTSPGVARCAPVTVEVVTAAPVIGLPFVGAFSGGSASVSVQHTEMLDAFRSGLPGPACG